MKICFYKPQKCHFRWGLRPSTPQVCLAAKGQSNGGLFNHLVDALTVEQVAAIFATDPTHCEIGRIRDTLQAAKQGFDTQAAVDAANILCMVGLEWATNW